MEGSGGLTLAAQLTDPNHTISHVYTVSPIGTTYSGLVYKPNNGADFGPDTPSTLTSGIAEAIAAASTTGSLILLLPGTFNVTVAITMQANITIRGSGSYTSIISNTTGTNSTLISVASGCSLMDLQLILDNGHGTAVIQDVSGSPTGILLSNVYVNCPVTGLSLTEGASDVQMIGCTFNLTGGSLYAINLSDCTELAFTGCQFIISYSSSGPTGVYLSGSSVTDVTFTGCSFQVTDTAQVWAMEILGCADIVISGCTFDGGNNTGIILGSGVNSVAISGCTFHDFGYSSNTGAIQLGDSTSTNVFAIMISTCTFYNSNLGSAGVYVTGTNTFSQVVVAACRFDIQTAPASYPPGITFVACRDYAATFQPAIINSSLTVPTSSSNQNLYGRDIVVYVPATYSPAAGSPATLTPYLGPSSSPPALPAETDPGGSTAGFVRTYILHVPAGWYWYFAANSKVTLTTCVVITSN